MIDFNLDVGGPIKNKSIDNVLQQISLLFDTKQRELLGNPEFGTNYERYLYDLKLTNDQLAQIILSDIQSLDLLDYEPSVEVHLLQGTEQDIALINIELKKDYEVYNQIYRIE